LEVYPITFISDKHFGLVDISLERAGRIYNSRQKGRSLRQDHPHHMGLLRMVSGKQL
jgi:hypothetical protein